MAQNGDEACRSERGGKEEKEESASSSDLCPDTCDHIATINHPEAAARTTELPGGQACPTLRFVNSFTHTWISNVYRSQEIGTSMLGYMKMILMRDVGFCEVERRVRGVTAGVFAVLVLRGAVRTRFSSY